MKQKHLSYLPYSLLVIFLIIVLVLTGCGGSSFQDAAVEEVPAVEEAVDVVEEVEEMAEEAMEEEASDAIENIDTDVAASGSEEEDGSPYDPAGSTKAEPARDAAEVALSEASDEVRIVEVEVERVVEVEGSSEAVSVAPPPDKEPPADTTLTAGEIDDNEYWDDYLLYLRQYDGPEIIWVDVVERHTVTVLDGNGRPIVGEQIDLTVGDQLVARRHTHSNGQFMIFPNALNNLSESDQIVATLVSTGDTLTIQTGGNQRDWELSAPTYNTQTQAQLDILFLIDGTGSMADEIEQLRANMIAISEQISDLPSQPTIRYGLSVYRDQNDLIPSQSHDFVTDVNTFTNLLNQIEADGGGDYPEDLVLGLANALDNSWQVTNTVSLVFLIADAPPHLDYDYQYSYADNMQTAAAKGIKLYSIASSGLDEQGEYIFRQMSQFTGGRFIFLTYGEEGAGTTGTQTDVTVDPDNYTVGELDQLIVNIVEEELANFSDLPAN